MSRKIRIAFVVALVALPAAVAAAALRASPVLVTNCHEALYKPKSITLSCGDASTVLTKLTWKTWTSTTAGGKGVYNVNPCVPNCVSGKFKHYPVSVALSSPKRCTNPKRTVFDRIAITFTNQKPGKNNPMRETLGCPLH
jgi:hypothetical protein